jgi:hypothetical protein
MDKERFTVFVTIARLPHGFATEVKAFEARAMAIEYTEGRRKKGENVVINEVFVVTNDDKTTNDRLRFTTCLAGKPGDVYFRVQLCLGRDVFAVFTGTDKALVGQVNGIRDGYNQLLKEGLITQRNRYDLTYLTETEGEVHISANVRAGAVVWRLLYRPNEHLSRKPFDAEFASYDSMHACLMAVLASEGQNGQ